MRERGRNETKEKEGKIINNKPKEKIRIKTREEE